MNKKELIENLIFWSRQLGELEAVERNKGTFMKTMDKIFPDLVMDDLIERRKMYIEDIKKQLLNI